MAAVAPELVLVVGWDWALQLPSWHLTAAVQVTLHFIGSLSLELCRSYAMGKARAVFKSLRLTGFRRCNWSTPGHLNNLDGRGPLACNWSGILDLNRFVFQAALSSGLDDGKASRKQISGGSTGKGGATAPLTVASFPQASPLQEVLHGAAWLQRLWGVTITLEVRKTLNL
eukprot:s1293_g16.t1